ncbi:hypothetical protein ALP75_205517 [Pseudomonas syringae pv. actinidiae]|nr:hypothetical protein ALP75_205517 [Pseudomonas syringae pv. actinidiae]
MGNAGCEHAQRRHSLRVAQVLFSALALTLRIVEFQRQLRSLLITLFCEQAILHQGGGLSRQCQQCKALLLGQDSRPDIDHTHGAQRMAGIVANRRACIEPDVRRAEHQRALLEARVSGGIFHHQHIGRLQDGVRTECQVAVGFSDVKADAGLEPLALPVNQRNQGDRRIAQRGGEQHDIVEVLLGSAVQYLQVLKRQDSIFLAGGKWRRVVGHGGAPRSGKNKVL